MGDTGRHDQALTLPEDMNLPANGKAARTLQHRYQRVAAGGVGADLLALFKGEESEAHVGVLRQRAADHLALLIGRQVLQPQDLVFGDVFHTLVHTGNPQPLNLSMVTSVQNWAFSVWSAAKTSVRQWAS